MLQLKSLENKDFGKYKALDFENLVISFLEKDFEIARQVFVQNRYDGRRGRIDLVLKNKDESIAIEIDRKTPRKKSIFKLGQIDVQKRFVIVRSPFSIIEIKA